LRTPKKRGSWFQGRNAVGPVDRQASYQEKKTEKEEEQRGDHMDPIAKKGKGRPRSPSVAGDIRGISPAFQKKQKKKNS